MKRYSGRHGMHTVSELNVTPLLDLAFVLLIIFMITTPLMDNAIELQLPKSGAPEQPVDPGKVQTISIDRQEQIKFNGQSVTVEQLAAALADLRKDKPDVAVVVRSHRELPVQKVVDLLDVVKAAQITRVGVVTNPQE